MQTSNRTDSLSPPLETTMTGLAVTMLQEIAGVLNLTFSLEAATAHSITSGSWGGVARKMKAHRRDLIINGLPLAWDLAHALDTSVPVLRTSYGIGLKVWPLVVCSGV